MHPLIVASFVCSAASWVCLGIALYGARSDWLLAGVVFGAVAACSAVLRFIYLPR